MDDAQEAQVSDLLAAVPAEDRAQLQALSEGWRAWRLSYLLPISDDPRMAARLEQAVADASGWPRGRVLALAAVPLWLDPRAPGGTAHWQQRAQALQAAVEAMPADWPPVERCVTEVRLAELELRLGRSEQVLERILRLDRLDFPPPLDDRMHANVRQMLVVLLLEMGDLEGALVASQSLLRFVEQGPARSVSLYYNHLLALGLGGHAAQVQAFLDERPHLRDPAFWHEIPQAMGLLAWLDARAHPDAPTPSWPEPTGSQPGAERSPMWAGLAWMRAELCVHRGQPREAVDVLQSHLQQIQANHSGSLTPLNGTMIFQTLSRAQEALGDTATALDSLRRAQAHGHEWTLRSTGARLKALHLAAPESSTGVQSRRMQALQGAQNPQAPDTATRLLAHVSHEMRNPLNGVLGMIALLQMSELSEAQRRQLQLADSSARMALTLCNDLLDLAKIDAGRLEIRPAPCLLTQALDEVVQTFLPSAQLKGVDLRMELDATLHEQVLLDRLRLQQVLMNLVANAIKFTRRGHVLLSARWVQAPSGGRLRVEVSDTGIGIAPHEQERLFQEFSQANGSVEAEFGGTGLGLALCRKLVRAMGGHIDLSSTPGQGSCFWFEIPCQPLSGLGH